MSALEALRPDHSMVLTADGNLKGEFERRGFSVETNAKDFVRGLRLERTGEKLVTPDISEILNELRGGGGEEFPKDFHYTLQEIDTTYAELFLPGAVIERAPSIDLKVALQRVDDLGRDDREIRLKILSYVHWFAPISKDDLAGILQERQIAEKIVLSNSERLVDAGTIRDTGTHYLPGKDGVCEAIADSRIHELTELI